MSDIYKVIFMVDGVNPISTGAAKYDITFAELDANKDGVVNKDDYELLKGYINDDDESNDINVTVDNLDEIFASVLSGEKDKLEDCPDCKAPEEAGSNDNTASSVNESNVLDKADTALKNRKDLDVKDVDTLKVLNDIRNQLTEQIAEYDSLAKILLSKLENLKEELDKLNEQKEAEEKTYETTAQTTEEKSAALNDKLKVAASKSEEYNNEKETESNSVIAKCIEDYKNGKYQGQDLATVIATQLGLKVSVSDSGVKNAFADCEALGDDIKELCDQLTKVQASIESLTDQYNIKNTEYNSSVKSRENVLSARQADSVKFQEAYNTRATLRQGVIDKYKAEGNSKEDSTNGQIAKLDEFLKADELGNMGADDALVILQGAFDKCGISVADGTVTIPTGLDDASKAAYNSLAERLTCLFPDDIKVERKTSVEPSTPRPSSRKSGCDPMSFTKDNVKYDFIQDRDNDGVFDDATEFLGAKNGWEEMKAYDADGNGKIEGDELKSLQMVAMDQTTGKYSFTTAAEAGITSIDLSTYQEVNKTDVTDDLIQGQFKINIGDETVDAVQTVDQDINLQNKYGVLFGGEIKDLNNTYEENPFQFGFNPGEHVDVDKLDKKAENDIDDAKNDAKNDADKTDDKISDKTDGAENKGAEGTENPPATDEPESETPTGDETPEDDPKNKKEEE